MELKIKLKQLSNIENEQLRSENLELLADAMLKNIGTVDPELRDSLIYSTFMRLIGGGFLADKQLLFILETCLDEAHLFYRLGEKDTDSVFTRSFSSLVITKIIAVDGDMGFLSEEILLNAFERSIEYLKNENDTRGYVKDKGWAHSIAHGADLLNSISKHPKFKKENFQEVLSAIHNCLFKDGAYIDDEDERLIFAIESLIERNLEDEELEKWVLQIFDALNLIHINEGFSNKYFQTKVNIANFMKTLYFRLGFKNNNNSLRDIINSKLKELYLRHYGR